MHPQELLVYLHIYTEVATARIWHAAVVLWTELNKRDKPRHSSVISHMSNIFLLNFSVKAYKNGYSCLSSSAIIIISTKQARCFHQITLNSKRSWSLCGHKSKLPDNGSRLDRYGFIVEYEAVGVATSCFRHIFNKEPWSSPPLHAIVCHRQPSPRVADASNGAAKWSQLEKETWLPPRNAII